MIQNLDLRPRKTEADTKYYKHFFLFSKWKSLLNDIQNDSYLGPPLVHTQSYQPEISITNSSSRRPPINKYGQNSSSDSSLSVKMDQTHNTQGSILSERWLKPFLGEACEGECLIKQNWMSTRRTPPILWDMNLHVKKGLRNPTFRQA